MTPIGEGAVTHPNCDFMASDQRGSDDPFGRALKTELTDMIRWAESTSPRSQQLAVGPSELGNACDRRLAYRIAGTDAVNTTMDPWPAIVGTSIHSWTEKAILRFMAETGQHDWLTEVRLQPDPLVPGSSDLYKISTATVVDLKTAGTDVFKRIKRNGPPDGYKIQTHLYGLGHENAGRRVESVALVIVPRAGWLRDMYVWWAPYERGVAQAAIDRLYGLANRLLQLDILHNGQKFADILAEPGDGCVWCPFFVRDHPEDLGASQRGCPGR